MHDAHPAPDVLMLQQEDLVAFGRLIIMLCCANPHSVSNLSKAMEIIGRHYSSDVKNVVLFLITKPTPHKARSFLLMIALNLCGMQSISQLFDMLGSRLLTEMDEMQKYVQRSWE
jgi:PAB-dependent poly(A)-specific ribonuclease subunit 3